MNMLGIAMKHVSFGMVSSRNLFRTLAVAPKVCVAIILIHLKLGVCVFIHNYGKPRVGLIFPVLFELAPLSSLFPLF